VRFLVALLLVFAATACGGTHLDLTSNPGRYDQLAPEWVEEVRAAREAFEIAEYAVAREHLDEVRRNNPRHIGTETFLQDVQLAALESGPDLEGLAAPARSEEAARLLLEREREGGEETPSVVHLVLAGRLADGEESLALLARAVEEDPECIWAHYGTAFRCFAMRRFPEAREAMERARELDPGHLPTMRLHAAMLAAAGDSRLAIRVLSTWLERTLDDPLVSRTARAEALLDLAALHLLDGKGEEALELLARIEVERLEGPARYELALAAAHEAEGEIDLALAAARRAWALDSENLLALVQEAMLIERMDDDPGGEREVWERLLDAAAAREAPDPRSLSADEASVDFQSLLIQLMARTRLERLREQEPRLGDVERR
jgi:tetratricopeptide (TPR) repeat protein